MLQHLTLSQIEFWTLQIHEIPATKLCAHDKHTYVHLCLHQSNREEVPGAVKTS